MKYCGPDIQCCVTGMYGADLHHITSRKAGGNDEPWNLLPLVHALHVECEQIGLRTFAAKYPAVQTWLISNGWSIEMDKWRHPNSHRKI